MDQRAHDPWMLRALELAERGRGYVEPNPLVGAVVVHDGQVVGEGWHHRFGEAHAEVNALTAAGPAARDATMYVTLEPCCHQGKTPPCTDAIIRSGIRRVVAAMIDPFPEVAGKGTAQLRAAGMTVEIGPGESAARRLNAPYLRLLATGHPYVHVKWAMTLDGKIATRSGDSKWISNEESRRRVHALRGRMDAIIVGIGTILADDPELTARPPGPRTPARVILDSSGRLPHGSVMARTAREVPVILAAASTLSSDRAGELHSLGCEVIQPSGTAPRPDVLALLDQLGHRRMTNVLVEGGAGVLGSFLDARAIDEVHVFISPRLAGGLAAKSAVAGVGVEKISESLRLSDWHSEQLGDDILLHGWLAPLASSCTSQVE
jgi:diaminohydroxyphosphoribosylaminopyrimidine deaminase/5-amino-6-(5-phosphoribosylamino)uracil reductase